MAKETKFRFIRADHLAKLDEDTPIQLKQWKLTDQGIDTVDDKYFIDKSRLNLAGEDSHDCTWLEHMSEKEWVDIIEFQYIFFRALNKFKGYYTPIPDEKLLKGVRKAIKTQMLNRREFDYDKYK